MRLIIIIFLQVCFVTLLSSCTGNYISSVDHQLSPAKDLERLVGRYYQEGIFQGTVLVAKDRMVVYQAGIGMADMEWRVSNGVDTKYDIASLTKSFTALRLLQLAEQGVVNIDDPIEKYLPQFKGRPAAGVTLRELMTHTSGFKEHVDLDLAAMPSDLISKSDSLPMIEKMKVLLPYAMLTTERGKFHYSNDGYALLGWLIEAASGISFDENIRHITNAAGMRDTGISYHKKIVFNRARSYQRENESWVNSPFEDASQNQGAGSLYSTVGDLMKLDGALRDGKLLSKESLKLFNDAYVDSWNVFGFSNFSHGWWVKNDEVLGRVAMHPGASARFSSLLIRGIDRDFTLIVLSNVSSVANMNIYSEGFLQKIRDSYKSH